VDFDAHRAKVASFKSRGHAGTEPIRRRCPCDADRGMAS